MKQKGKLLIVDDESAFLKILSLMFSKYYEVRTASNGMDALAILNEGFNAEVILSDQRMPSMSGAEFLEKSIAVVPAATRVILTGYTTAKDIIPAINQAHAYMYLMKPADEMSLVQSIKIAFDYYKNNRRIKMQLSENKKAIAALNDKNDELNAQMSANAELINQSVQAISGAANYVERFYFTNHTKFIAVTAKQFAEDVGLSKDRITDIVLASLLNSSVFNSMPMNFILNDPFDLETDEQRQEYLFYFRSSLTAISKVKKLAKYSQIISNIWEHNDGSGFPAMLPSNLLSFETQIISIVNYYHNNVYRLEYKDLNKFLKEGMITQTAIKTKLRHAECIKSLYRHATWFDYDIFHHFQDIIKKKSIANLVPDTEELRVLNLDQHIYEALSKQTPEPAPEIDEDIITITTSTGEKMAEKILKVAQLEPGMSMGQTLLSKSGMLVVNNESVLDEATIKNMQQLEQSGMIPGEVTILIPYD